MIEKSSHSMTHCICTDSFQILKPVTALLAIDVQNDFISGSLALKQCPAKQDGEAVVPVINKMLDEANFDLVVYSCDWHPANHISFIDCVQQRDIHHSSKVSGPALAPYALSTIDSFTVVNFPKSLQLVKVLTQVKSFW